MDVLEVIAEPRRRRILQLVWSQELAAGEIASSFDVSFSAVSQHLAVLRRAGVVRERSEGRKRLYLARREALGLAAPLLEAMWAEKLRSLKSLAEVEQRSIDRGAINRGAIGRRAEDGGPS